MCSYMKLRAVVQEEMSFKEKVYGRTTDGRTDDSKDRSQYLTLSLRRCYITVSHFSYAPLIKCKINQKRNMIFFILRLPA